MKLGKNIEKILGKTYPPATTVSQRMGRYDLVFKTDASGRPILLFIGAADENGRIKGEKFARRLVADDDGKLIKDHWDNKGKVS